MEDLLIELKACVIELQARLIELHARSIELQVRSIELKNAELIDFPVAPTYKNDNGHDFISMKYFSIS